MSKVASVATAASVASIRNKSDSPKKSKSEVQNCVGNKNSSDANSGNGTPTAAATSESTRGEKSAKCKSYFLHLSIPEK